MIYLIIGTRPEIIKIAPLIEQFDNSKFDYRVVFTNQHYKYELSEAFFEELKLDKPNYQLGIGSGTESEQTARIILKVEKILLHNKPDLVLVQGDTTSALAGALTAVKMQIPVGHIEAGLRSYDFRMSEEYNRRLIDHISSFLFAPTDYNKTTLLNENVWGQVFKTGNTGLDACIKYSEIAQKHSSIMNRIDFENFLLFTTHRSENVDDNNTLYDIIGAILEIDYPTVFPVHPRTSKQLKKFGLYEKLAKHQNMLLLPPISYFDLLKLMIKCDFIITDSGGIQEEATAPPIRKYTFVIRQTTDRPEACDKGFANLVGTKKSVIVDEVSKFLKNPIKPPDFSPFGAGDASEKIIDILRKKLTLN
jgi:UDP-N-acetylglucosamine 2-epimerase (non-hydrolysing)